MTETWVILGAGSSIARAFAHEAAATGAGIILVGRDAEDLRTQCGDLRIRHGVPADALVFDARDTQAHAGLARAVDAHALEAQAGTINVFAAFGWMPPQAESEADPALALEVIAVNFAGMVSLLLHLAPLLERRQAGRVVVLGSVAGDRGRLSNHIYGSAKAGLHAFLQGLRARLWRSGITVTTVKPGFTDTAMTWGVKGMALVASPQAVARRCLSQAGKGAEEVYVPAFWWVIMTIIRAIPERLFKRLSL
ncbi:MAG: SDR family NAD(P)-dependent oxidoreductase [Magnetospirillum sp.]|nr:SDR family NAD(P)-dependent oxidoreductase [Magnetospirillum sp.]